MNREEATAAVVRRARGYRDASNRYDALAESGAGEGAQDDAWDEFEQARRELLDALDDLDEVEGR